jgi:membrane protein DedA with SNARE-associated domain
MSIISTVIGSMGIFAVSTISYLGYFGVFFLMALESMIFPIPAELVMPFAGYLAGTGQFTMVLVFVASTLGSLAGSLISYYVGYYGGNKLVLRYGKYLFLDAEDLKKTEQWFKKRGEGTIFVGRLIPVVRHIISIPAGIGKMNLQKFVIYTCIGAAVWNMFLAYLGYVLGKNWALIRHYTEPLSIIVAVLLVGGFGYFIYHHIVRKKRHR